MAKAKKVGPSITLEIDGGGITSEKFLSAVESFFALIQEVTNEVTQIGAEAPRKKSVEWVISVKSGSDVICATPRVLGDAKTNPAVIVNTIQDGVRKIGHGQSNARSRGYNDKALESLRDLSSLYTGSDGGISRITVRTSKHKKSVTDKTVAKIDEILGVSTTAYGSVEGFLRSITVHRSNYFGVYDALTDKAVRCYFSNKEISDSAIAAFQRRVCVSGLIRYKQNGEPSSIVVDKIRIFRDPESLPSIEEMRGILGRY